MVLPGSAGNVFPRIDPSLMITPHQAWKWNAFKAEAGPTYAGSVGWKRYIDFLIARMTEFGAVDFDYVEIVAEIERDPEAITIGADPYVMIRPEGRWHVPGVLERSSTREVTRPSVEARAS